MEICSLKEIAEACQGRLQQGPGSITVEQLCTDSRKAQRGELFIAIQGERYDGHDFVDSAIQKGVAAIMINRSWYESCPAVPRATPAIVVQDTRKALGTWAASYRNQFDLPVIAIGGSNGKTSAKELLASVLRMRYKTLWNEASYNNDLGVPLTLLRLTREHEVLVQEVGTNHMGEIEGLVHILKPSIGLVTSIGREHLEFLGSISGVIDEEGRLAEALPSDGWLFINGDCLAYADISRRSQAEGILVGFEEHNKWKIQDYQMHTEGSAFTVSVAKPGFSGRYQIPVYGRHQSINASLAIAVGEKLGLTPAEIRHGLLRCQRPKHRLELRQWEGISILDDTYNANPDSMLAALNTLCEAPGAQRRIAVLGEMAELGTYSEESHREIGYKVAELNIDHLFIYGEQAAVIGQAARVAKFRNITQFESLSDGEDKIRAFLSKGDIVLFKASRSVGLDRLSAKFEA
jgi:UDP-N-acetylmuramoyl-tripeptide--D-alanyl-D-alanine ligase